MPFQKWQANGTTIDPATTIVNFDSLTASKSGDVTTLTQSGAETVTTQTATVKVITPILDAIAAGALSLGPTTATSITLNQNTNLSAGKTLTLAAGAGSIDGVLGTGAFKIGAATATIGFYGVTAAARPSAYTQTYATAAKTVPIATVHALTDSTTGTVSTTQVVAIGVGAVDVACALAADVRNALATLNAENVLLAADVLALKKLINAIIDDGQVVGLLA